jgi:nucleotide-binding universal stress UspA family protein
MTLPKKILVPHDFGTGSDHALAYAVGLAKALGAEVTVMHAFEIPMVGFPDGTLVATPELVSRILEGVNVGLKKAVELHAGAGVTMHSLVKQGPTWQTITETATERGADLIVMGTHGRHGIPRALLGSVAEKVVRMAHCPVLTLHPADSNTST